jgi:hypothetical protein
MSDKPDIRDPWRAWRDQQVATLDLGEIGLDGMWIKVRLTSSMTNAEVESMRDSGDEVKESMRKWVIEWNLPGPDGEVLPVPSQSDDWYDHVPFGVLATIGRMIARADEEKLEVPTPSGRP